MASSARPAEEDPDSDCLVDESRCRKDGSSRAQALAHPATIRGQSAEVLASLPESLCVPFGTTGGGDDFFTRTENGADGNCLSYAIINGVRAASKKVGEITAEPVWFSPISAAFRCTR